MTAKTPLLALLCALYGFLAWLVYLMVAQPLRFVDLFMQRRYRGWGLRVTIEDEGKLRRRARALGWLLAVFFAAHAALVFGTVLRCGK